ncbi:hypothetical protein FRX31_006356 [Thalictrum thalictroides]|uniref:F-box domain-containing protein n=1 Tax=Thalictrum thalictroides TaxID=46969 RepID=A0A7J6X3T0_THATH|nr:hypothetical protein FRX31_006356 [Thalictrum thalictroides]
MTEICVVDYSKWSELPIRLLSEILKRLDFIDDYVRFGAVCVSWRIAAFADKPDSTPVFLLVHSPLRKDKEEDENKVEEEKTNDKKRKLNKQEVEEKIKTILAGRARSLYSFSSKRICNFQLYLRKAILSSDPLYAPKKFVVLSIIGKFARLAFYNSTEGEIKIGLQ